MSDNKDITPHDGASRQLATATAGSVLAMVLEAARDPNIDAAKVETMANLAMRMQDRELEAEFNRAKIAALMQMPSIGKKGEIRNKEGKVQYSYSKWEDIHRIIKPILDSHGLALSFNVGNVVAGQNTLVTVQPILQHRNGFKEVGGEMSLPIDTTGSKNGTQGAGSAASYGKRHSAKAMLNIVEHNEDDDGASAGNGPTRRPLNELQEILIADGNAAAKKGAASYEQWFKERSAAERGWLAMEGYHEELKQAAGV